MSRLTHSVNLTKAMMGAVDPQITVQSMTGVCRTWRRVLLMPYGNARYSASGVDRPDSGRHFGSTSTTPTDLWGAV